MNAALELEECLFETARGLADPSRRRAFLDQACGSDVALRTKLEELLNAGTHAEEFFAGCAPAFHASALLQPGQLPSLPPDARTDEPEKTSTRIGPYKLLQKIG